MENELINVSLNNEGRISSVDLVDIINYFRKEESTEDKPKAMLQHKDFMKKIRRELEVLVSLGLGGERNISQSSYINSQNKEQPCYSLNKDGMLMMLNSESTLVRYKTVEYINKLETKLKELTTPSYMITDPIERAKAWIKEEEQRQLLESKNKELKLENNQQKQVIGELKPKADYTDIILRSKGLVTVTQIAKDYGMSARSLNSKLHELGIQYKQSGQWLLYSKYHDSGFTKSETYSITRKDGETEARLNTKWTQKGRLFLYDMLKDNGILPTIEK